MQAPVPPPQPLILIASWDFGVIIGTFLLSLTVVYMSYRQMALDGDELNECIGTPKWDFSSSWATTLTAVGALLGTVLLTPNISSINMQSGLSLFFGLLVLIAPLIYTASVKRLPPDPEAEDKSFQYQGTIRMFLITATLTVWAVSGELVTVGSSLIALLNQAFISVLSLVVFILVLLLALFYTYVYGYKSILWTIKDVLFDKASQQLTRYKKNNPEFSYEIARPHEAIEKLPSAEQAKVKRYNPPRKNWSLL